MAEREKKVLQWHPAFFAGIQIEFAEEADKLTFENEHQLGTKPREIDVLIIKKNFDEQIHKNIGQIFRTYNIVEYKSPKDHLSIDDFYKVYGYACFYKSDVKQADSIKAEDITISFVCKNYPRKMMTHLQKVRKLKVEKREEGIYYLYGDIFPMQLILTSKLSKENNFWLRNLTNDLKEENEAETLVLEYSKHQKSKLHQSVMDIIVRANIELFNNRRDSKMCEALMEIVREQMQEEIEEIKNTQRREGINIGKEQGIGIGEDRKLQEQILKKIQKGKSVEKIAEELEEDKETIERLMKSL